MKIENLILENHVMFAVLLIIVIRIIDSTFKYKYLQAFLLIISTYLHELSHLIIGFILNGKPSSMSIIPKSISKNITELGYVRWDNLTWYNRIPIGLSPLLIIIVAYYLDVYFFIFFQQNIFTIIIYIYLLATLLLNSIPSKEDLYIAFSCLTGIIFYGLLGICIYKIYEKGIF